MTENPKARFKFQDITGRKFNRLTAQWPIAKEGSTVRWLCLCECGKIITTTYNCLRMKNTKSCGCLKLEKSAEQGRSKKMPDGRSAFNSLFGGYKQQAKERGLSFTLSEDEFRALITSNCFYCNKSPQQIRVRQSSRFTYNGIDRRNNAIGYDAHNVVACCKTCNFMKVKLGENEFITACRAVAQHQNQKMLVKNLPKSRSEQCESLSQV